MNKIVNEMHVVGKKVIVRVDYNVPVKDGVIVDTKRIDESLKTINYLIAQGSKVILMSHFGKVKSEDDKTSNSLRVVFDYLVNCLKTEVYFSEYTRGEELEKLVDDLKPGNVLLMENTRFEDLNNKGESSCSDELSSYWSSLGEVFVFDAFGSAHRAHASTVGIAKRLNSCFGFLVANEIDLLTKYVLRAGHPFTIIMGGAKIDDKLLMMKELISKCDHMLVGGGIANTFLKVLDYNVGESLASSDPLVLEEVKKILIDNANKIILPIDVVVGRKYDKSYVQLKKLDEVEDNDMILDIGYLTIQAYKEVLSTMTQTLFVNGTVGYSEDVKFANGTKEILNIIKSINCIKVAGGGDAVAAATKFGYTDAFTFLSTGGGASLDFITNGSLVVVDEIKRGIECL